MQKCTIYTHTHTHTYTNTRTHIKLIFSSYSNDFSLFLSPCLFQSNTHIHTQPHYPCKCQSHTQALRILAVIVESHSGVGRILAGTLLLAVIETNYYFIKGVGKWVVMVRGENWILTVSKDRPELVVSISYHCYLTQDAHLTLWPPPGPSAVQTI